MFQTRFHSGYWEEGNSLDISPEFYQRNTDVCEYCRKSEYRRDYSPQQKLEAKLLQNEFCEQINRKQLDDSTINFSNLMVNAHLLLKDTINYKSQKQICSPDIDTKFVSEATNKPIILNSASDTVFLNSILIRY